MALDIGGIRTAFKTIFDLYNDTTATYDLSTGLSKRVKNVFKIKPNEKNINASYLPVITCWTDSKNVEIRGICKNQISSKRKGEIDFSIAGIIWNSNFSGISEDPAYDDAEKLMENIEEVLRLNDTLNGTVLYQYPTTVTYHDISLSEQIHFRVGIATIRCGVFY